MIVAAPSAYMASERLEAHLGDPFSTDGPFGFAAILAADEAEAFPEAACAELMAWGFTKYFVPTDCGGELRSYEEALALLRTVSRRDLSVAIALGQTYLGAVHVWIGGTPAARAAAAALIAGGDSFAFALTEREHGSDVLAGEAEAAAVDGGYRISGEKWLINNGTRARVLTMFARTGAPGPRGYSLFWVDVAALPRQAYERLAKVPTHGIRGADISGIRLTGAYVPAAARIGAEGAGLELALKGLMITRTMCAGFALGAADTALRLAVRFAAGRRLYGAPILALGAVRRQLVEAFATLIAADVLAIVACRALHVSPQQTSIRSAIVKFTVPALAEEIVRETGTILGARSFVRDALPWSVHQKIARDVAVVGLFDGNSAVNLHAIVVQLPALLRARTAGVPDAGRDERLRRMFAGDAELEPFDAAGISLANRGRDDVVDGLATAAAELEQRAAAQADAALTWSAEIAAGLVAAHAELAAQVAAFTTQAARTSADAYTCARRYCYIHAGAAIVHWLVYGPQSGPRSRVGTATLACAAAQLAQRAGLKLRAPLDELANRAADDLLALEREDRLFSVAAFALADAPAR